MEFRTRLNVFLYGSYILEAMALDVMLKHIQLNGMTQFTINRIATEESIALQKDLDYLVTEQLIKPYSNNHYQITKKGDLKLASGGFKDDAKKSKNALYAFRISIVAITLTIINFLVSLFSE